MFGPGDRFENSNGDVLATVEWETNKTFQPVREAYWLNEDWRRAHLKYYPYYGRGFVQLTWKSELRHV